MTTYSGDITSSRCPLGFTCVLSVKKMARHIVCVLDRMVGHVSFCWDYVSIFIYKNSNYNKINQICACVSWYLIQITFINLFTLGKNFSSVDVFFPMFIRKKFKTFPDKTCIEIKVQKNMPAPRLITHFAELVCDTRFETTSIN